MRFRRLAFKAFGPFTGLELELAGGAPGGLHVIYGRNEAGKTSALRGVHDLLFGIPERTGDDHVHRGPELCIAATLERDGTCLEIQRLKRRKDSLRDAKNDPLDERTLSELLGGLDASQFERLFGLDHERLKRAADAMLEDDGDVGESLFDAGTGGSSIRQVLAELESEADLLYKPRAHKVRLSLLLESYTQAKREARERQNPPEKVHAQQARLAERQSELERVGAMRRALRAELEEKTRLQSLLPAVAQRAALLEKRSALGARVDFSEPEEERRVAAERALVQAEQERDHYQREGARTLAEQAELVVPEGLATLSEAIVQELRDRTGKHRAAQGDLPKRRAALATSELEAKHLLSSVFPGRELQGAERWRPADADLRRMRRLAERRPLLTARVATAERSLSDLSGEVTRIAEELSLLPALPRSAEYKRAISLARSAGDVDRRVRESAAESERSSLSASADYAKLGLFHGPLSAIPTLPVPSEETVTRFEHELVQRRQRCEAVAARLEEKRERLADVADQIGSIERVGTVPSEAELGTARAERDRGWSRVLGAWRAGDSPEAEDPESSARLPRSRQFELLLQTADATADRLRREAERVSELAQLRAEQAELERGLARLQSELSDTEQAERKSERNWQLAWDAAGIRALSVSEMRAWLARQGKLSERVEASQIAERAAEDAKAEQTALAFELARALELEAPEPGAWVMPLLLRCEDALAAASERATERAARQQTLADLERRKSDALRDRLEAAQEREAWDVEWARAAQALGFEGGLSAEDAGDAVTALVALFAKIDEVGLLRGRVDGIERDAALFAEWAESLARAHAPDLIGRAPDALAEELLRRIRAAQTAREQTARLGAELERRKKELEQIVERVETSEAELAALMRTVGARDRVELRTLAERARQGRELERQIEDIERQLLLAGGGQSLPDLLAATRGATQAELLARSAEIKEELDRADEQHQDLSGEVSALAAGLDSFAGSEAAEQAQTVALLGSELREQARRYARLRIGALVLRREIERYRAEHQGPVLKRATALFPVLTLGRYTGLRVGMEERTLTAVRSDGREVSVGELSEGTRYQLYLALRLASLERYLERNPALPLVLDDVLIHFDDDRASAAFRILGELAERTQILFFTHHARDLELSRQAVANGKIFCHELDRAPPQDGRGAAAGSGTRPAPSIS